MIYFIDTEFIEEQGRLDLVSIGIVAADGRTYYAENSECDLTRANDWFRSHVFPHLRQVQPKTREVIAGEILRFVGDDSPQFWAYGASFDHVLLFQLLKAFNGIPRHWPYFTFELAQVRYDLGNPELPNTNKCMHHALSDALWNKAIYELLAGMTAVVN